jgi:hypothetical protein
MEVKSEKQAEVLLRAILLGSCLVQVKRCTSINSSRGVVSYDSPDRMTDKYI